MKASVICTVAALALCSGGAVAAQTKPNFAGTWHPIRPAVASAAQDFTIKQDATTLTIISPGDGKTSNVYKLDGTESRNGAQVSKVTWEGTKLAITTTLGQYKMKMVYSLDASGSLVTEANNPPPLGSGTPVTIVYRKK